MYMFEMNMYDLIVMNSLAFYYENCTGKVGSLGGIGVNCCPHPPHRHVFDVFIIFPTEEILKFVCFVISVK